MMYQLYNLVIASESLPLPVTSTVNTNVDVWVEVISSQKTVPSISTWFMQWHLPGNKLWLSLAKIDGGYLLRFNELADFLVMDNGDKIDCIPNSQIPLETIQHLLLDQVIPLVINLRGGEALHASAVVGPHGAIAFAGPAGSGKSTLAGSFLGSGYRYMSDDCLRLLIKDELIYGIPAYPGLRLWEDASSHLFGGDGSRKPVAHYTDKFRVGVEDRSEAYCSEVQPLRKLYILADPPRAGRKVDIVIGQLTPQEGFMLWVRSVFRLDIKDQKMLRRQFHFLEWAASRVSVRRLTFPRDFNFLPAVREAIVNDLKDLDN